MEQAELTALHNLQGADALTRELLAALIEINPARESVVSIALERTQQLRDMLIARPQPEAVLAGMDMHTAHWRKAMEGWRQTST